MISQLECILIFIIYVSREPHNLTWAMSKEEHLSVQDVDLTDRGFCRQGRWQHVPYPYCLQHVGLVSAGHV